MKAFSNFIQSESYRQLMQKLYGIGASVVLLGALFKLMHWTGASWMLVIGMSTEAIIFFCSAFEPSNQTFESGNSGSVKGPKIVGVPKIDLSNVDASQLGDNINSISAAAAKMANVTQSLSKASESLSSAQALGEEIKKTRTAAATLGAGLEESHKKLSGALNDMHKEIKTCSEQLHEGNDKYWDRLQLNLKSLNAIQELHIKDAKAFQGEAESFHGELKKFTQNIQSTAAESQKIKTAIGEFRSNVEQLNQVYGSLLSAVNGLKKK